MPLFGITVKQSKNLNGIRIKKGISVSIGCFKFINIVLTNGGRFLSYIWC